jgi:hypothetical protein
MKERKTVRVLVTLLLLTLPFGPLSPAAVYPDRADGRGYQVCGQGDSHGQSDAAHDQSFVSHQRHSGDPAHGKCATGAWCLTGSLIVDEGPVFMWSPMPAHAVPSLGEVVLKSVRGSPPVPPPIL